MKRINELEELICFTKTNAYEMLSKGSRNEIEKKKKELVCQAIKEAVLPIMEKWGEDAVFSISYNSSINEVTIEVPDKGKKDSVEGSFDTQSYSGQTETIPESDENDSTQVVSHRNSKALRITLPDGSIIQEKRASETFSMAIFKAGTERVESMNLKVAKVPIISHTIATKKSYAAAQHQVAKDVYIFTNLTNQHKKDILEQINEKYQLGWRIELV